MHLQQFAYNLTTKRWYKQISAMRAPNQNRVKCAVSAQTKQSISRLDCIIITIVIWQCFSRQLHQSIDPLILFGANRESRLFWPERQNTAKFVQTLKMNRKINV